MPTIQERSFHDNGTEERHYSPPTRKKAYVHGKIVHDADHAFIAESFLNVGCPLFLRTVNSV